MLAFSNILMACRANLSDDDWFASYYRVHSCKEFVDDVIVIRTAEELRTYAAQTMIDFIVDTRLREEIFDNIDKFDSDFFSRRSLCVILKTHGSGSIRHKVTSVVAKDGVLQVYIDLHRPEQVTADMAYWQIFIETDTIPFGWEPKVVWRNVPFDFAALSPPASALKGVSLENSQEADMLFAVFRFAGSHSSLFSGAFDTWILTRDGKELGNSDYSLSGDEYNYKRVIENNETTFYVPILLFSRTQGGIYAFSGKYQGKAFNTKPLNFNCFAMFFLRYECESLYQ